MTVCSVEGSVRVYSHVRRPIPCLSTFDLQSSVHLTSVYRARVRFSIPTVKHKCEHGKGGQSYTGTVRSRRDDKIVISHQPSSYKQSFRDQPLYFNLKGQNAARHVTEKLKV